MASASPLASLSLEIELEPLQPTPPRRLLHAEPKAESDAATAQQQKPLRVKRQRKNVLIVNFLAVLVTLAIFSILLEYTAIADRTAHSSSRLHFYSSNGDSTNDGNAGNAGNEGGATQLYASLVDVYEESDEDADAEGRVSTPLPSVAYQPNLPLDELHQLNSLFEKCMTQQDTVIGWASASFTLRENDPPELLLEKLSACPDVDVFVPNAIRGDNEYCQDAAVYTKFLQSRMLPRWVLDAQFHDAKANQTVTYFELCPKTPMLFLNHHWDALPWHPTWPTANEEKKQEKKQVYFMPNIDSTELQREHFLTADVVLCKTKACFSRVSAWYAQEAQRGNRRETKVLYTRFTSPNPSVPLQLQNAAIKHKQYEQVSFVHFAGSGDGKGTKQVLECWLSKPEFPPLEVFVDETKYVEKYKQEFDARIHSSQNVGVDTRVRDPTEWSKLVAEATFFVAPSESESYGHIINQARASGGVVVTTDVAPMNELMPGSSSMGVIVSAKRKINPAQFLGSGYKQGDGGGLQGGKGLVAEVTAKNVCDAVEKLLRTTQEQTRHAIGARAHRQYYMDMNIFAASMTELRAYARQHTDGTATPSSRPPEGVQRLGNLRSVAPIST